MRRQTMIRACAAVGLLGLLSLGGCAYYPYGYGYYPGYAYGYGYPGYAAAPGYGGVAVGYGGGYWRR
jgi:hypothetical protein